MILYKYLYILDEFYYTQTVVTLFLTSLIKLEILEVIHCLITEEVYLFILFCMDKITSSIKQTPGWQGRVATGPEVPADLGKCLTGLSKRAMQRCGE